MEGECWVNGGRKEAREVVVGLMGPDPNVLTPALGKLTVLSGISTHCRGASNSVVVLSELRQTLKSGRSKKERGLNLGGGGCSPETHTHIHTRFHCFHDNKYHRYALPTVNGHV